MGTGTAAKAPTADQKHDSDLWLKGREVFIGKLQGQKKYASDLEEFLKNGATVEAARDECMVQKDKAERQYSKGDVTIKGHKIFPKALLGKIMDNIHYAVDMGNFLVQGAPESVGLAWMAVSTMISTIQQDYAITNYIIAACADLTTILVRCRSKVKTFYESSREKASEMEQQLFQRLPEIYAEILDFSFWVKRHFKKGSGFKRFIPLVNVDKFTPKMENIKKLEVEVTKDADDVFHQKSITFQDKASYDLDSIRLAQNRVLENMERERLERQGAPRKTFFEQAQDEHAENKKKLGVPESSDVDFHTNLGEVQPETCAWVFELEQFDDWKSNEESSVLWLSGKEGSGKSVLTAAIIEALQTEMEPSDDACLQYYFCRSSTDSTADSIKTAIIFGLYDLATSSPELLARCNDAFRDAQSKKPGRGAAADGLQSKSKKRAIDLDEVFEKFVQILGKTVYVCIDALDQSSESSELLESFERFLDNENLNLKILISTRPEVDPPTNYDVERVDVGEYNNFDIQNTAKAEIKKLPGFTDAERQLACEKMVEKADGVFRYLQHGLEFLKQPWQRPLDKRLEELPDTLGQGYADALKQIDPNYADLLRTALIWTVLAFDTVKLTEIMDAYQRTYSPEDSAELIARTDDEEEEDEKLYARQLRSAGSAFLEVSSESPRVVSLKNKSIRQFFLDQSNFPHNPSTTFHDVCVRCRKKIDADPTFFVDPKSGFLQMAITCLQHLNSARFQERFLVPIDDDSTTDSSDSSDSDEDEEGEGADESIWKSSSNSSSSSGSSDSSSEEGVSGKGKGTAKSTTKVNDSSDDESSVDDSDDESSDDDSDDESSDDDSDEDDEDDQQNEGTEDDGQYEVDDSLRVEVTHWWRYMREADQLWHTEKLDKNDERWHLLWTLAEQFLCKSPDAFNKWQEVMWNWDGSFLWDCEKDYMKPLHVAAGLGITWLAEKLIQNGEQTTSLNTYEMYPAGYAADSRSDADLVSLLLTGINPNWQGGHKYSETAFWRFLRSNPSRNMIQVFLDHGADCKMTVKNGDQALHPFALNGTEPEALSLLLENGAEINAKDMYGETPLHILLSRDDIPMPLVKAFLDAKADVNAEDKESQMPLYEVSMEGDVDVVKLLLAHGAEYDDKDKKGRTALHTACEESNTKVVEALAEAGASLNEQDTLGRTPFFYACAGGDTETAQAMLTALKAKGIENHAINQADKHGKTPLGKAAANGLLETVVALTKDMPAADLNKQDDQWQRTALHAAAMNGHTAVVQHLLSAGAETQLLDSAGRTPLAHCHSRWVVSSTAGGAGALEATLAQLVAADLRTAAANTDLLADAAMKGSLVILRALLDGGADPDAKDQHQWTPLQLARQYGREEALALLCSVQERRGVRPSGWVSATSVVSVKTGAGDASAAATATATATATAAAATTAVHAGKGGRATVVSNHPVPSFLKEYYFEVEIQGAEEGKSKDAAASTAAEGLFLVVGLTNRPMKVADWLPGWYQQGVLSWGYSGDNGNWYCDNEELSGFKGPFGPGAVIGCGVDFASGTVFFTKDGRCLGSAFENGAGRLYPAVGLTKRSSVTANFGGDVTTRPFVWRPANEGGFADKITDEGYEQAVQDAVQDAVPKVTE